MNFVEGSILLLILLGLFFSQKNNQDLYRRFFPALKYNQTLINPKVNLNFLDQLRQKELEPLPVSTTTPTTTPEIVEPEKMIMIKSTTVGFLNVRSGPDASNNKIGEVKSGGEFKLLKEENSWYQIEFEKEKLGWVLSTFVDLIEVEVQDDAKEQVLDESRELETKIRVKPTSAGYLNVRSGPGVDYEKVAQISPGEEFFIVLEQAGWYEIKLADDKNGWVYATYVEKIY